MKYVMYAIAILLILASMVCVIFHVAVWDWVLLIAGFAVAVFSQTKYCYD